jgi:hypothetical protein
MDDSMELDTLSRLAWSNLARLGFTLTVNHEIGMWLVELSHKTEHTNVWAGVHLSAVMSKCSAWLEQRT